MILLAYKYIYNTCTGCRLSSMVELQINKYIIINNNIQCVLKCVPKSKNAHMGIVLIYHKLK